MSSEWQNQEVIQEVRGGRGRFGLVVLMLVLGALAYVWLGGSPSRDDVPPIREAADTDLPPRDGGDSGNDQDAGIVDDVLDAVFGDDPVDQAIAREPANDGKGAGRKGD